MLLQRHTGLVKLFPAIPSGWRDVSFSDLRAQGAFLVSAEMKNSQVNKVVITAENGGEIESENLYGHAVIVCYKKMAG